MAEDLKLLRILEEVQLNVINEALRRCGGNVARAAQDLGLPYWELRWIIRQQGIDIGEIKDERGSCLY